MNVDDVVKIGAGVGVTVGLVIHFARQQRIAADLGAKIRSQLENAGAASMSLPELVTRLGLRDGFLSRGKVMNVINPMVAAGELLQEEPPGTTVRNRLSVLRFRLRSESSR